MKGSYKEQLPIDAAKGRHGWCASGCSEPLISHKTDGGRRAYLEYLEKRAANDGGNLSEASMAALRRGWYLGDEAFRDRLLDLVKKGSKILVKKGSHAAAPIRHHGELEAEKIMVKGLKQFDLVDEAGCLSPGRKGDPRKVALASVVKAHTSVGNEWLATEFGGRNEVVVRDI